MWVIQMPVNPDIIRRSIEEVGEKIRIRFYVKPNSNKIALVAEEDELVFYTDEPPVRGRANASLIKFLSKSLKISTSKIRIVRGLKDRVKIVEIDGISSEDLINTLSRVAEPW